MLVEAERYRAAERKFWAAEGAEPAEDLVHLKRYGADLRLQRLGSGEPVVFLHGANTAGAVFAPLAARLAAFDCIVVDRPGCGLSEPIRSGGRNVAAFAAFADSLVPDLLDALGLDRAHVVATSLGGYFAVRAAAVHDESVMSVSLLGWSVGAPNGHLPLVMRVGGVRSLGRLMAGMPFPRAAVRPMLSQIGLRQAVQGGGVSEEMVEWFHSLLRDTDTMRNELVGAPPLIRPLRGMNNDILHSDVLLAGVRRPVQLLWGDDDPFGDLAVARDFSARFGNGELSVRAASGHAPWIDDPQGVADTVAAFLREHSG